MCSNHVAICFKILVSTNYFEASSVLSFMSGTKKRKFAQVGDKPLLQTTAKRRPMPPTTPPTVAMKAEANLRKVHARVLKRFKGRAKHESVRQPVVVPPPIVVPPPDRVTSSSSSHDSLLERYPDLRVPLHMREVTHEPLSPFQRFVGIGDLSVATNMISGHPCVAPDSIRVVDAFIAVMARTEPSIINENTGGGDNIQGVQCTNCGNNCASNRFRKIELEPGVYAYLCVICCQMQILNHIFVMQGLSCQERDSVTHFLNGMIMLLGREFVEP